MSSEATGREFDEAAMSLRLAETVTSIAGVRTLSPGLRGLVATATAKVLRRGGGEPEPVGVDVSRNAGGVRVGIDAHLDDSRSVAEIVDEIFAVIETEIATRSVEVDIATETVEVDIATETVGLDPATGTVEVDIATGTVEVDVAAGTVGLDGPLKIDLRVVSRDPADSPIRNE